MAITDKDIETIEQYVDGLLSGDDLVKFERRLEQEETIAHQVVSMKALRHSAKASVLQDKMKMLQQWDAGMGEVQEGEQVEDGEVSESKEDSKVRKLPWLKYVVVAASFVGILFVGKLWMDGVKNRNVKEKLFADLFIPYPDLISVRSNDQSHISKAMVQYSIGNYSKALEIFELTEIESNDINFYTGISYLGIQKYDLARNYLQNVDNDSYPKYYYLGAIDLLQEKHIKNIKEFCICNSCSIDMKILVSTICNE